MEHQPLAAAADRRAYAVGGRVAGEGRRDVAIFARPEPFEQGGPEIVREVNPSRTPRLADGCPDEPRLATLVEVTGARSLKFTDTTNRRV